MNSKDLSVENLTDLSELNEEVFNSNLARFKIGDVAIELMFSGSISAQECFEKFLIDCLEI